MKKAIAACLLVLTFGSGLAVAGAGAAQARDTNWPCNGCVRSVLH